MSQLQHFITKRIPDGWDAPPFWSLFRRTKQTGYADEELLSVYRDHGVIPKSSRDDNHNKPSEDLSGYQLVNEGSLVTNKMKAWQGSIAISRYRGIVSPAYYVYDPLSDEHDQFLHYLLRSDRYVALYGRISKGVRVNQWDLEHEALRNIPVMLPDRETQKTIADFLDFETARIDQLIEKRTRFNELMMERRQALFASAVTGSDDTSGAWLGNIPENWEAVRAKILYRESQARSSTGEEELLTVSHITGVTKRSEKDVNMFLAESNEGYKLVNPDDLIINTMCAWMGAMGISSESGLISPSYGVYSPISNDLRPAFMDMLVRSKPFIAEATRRSKGIHSSRLRLYPDAFLDMCLPVPPLAEQDRILEDISSRMAKEDLLLAKNQKADAVLKEFRSVLITAAVTGQIDVATWGKKGATDARLDAIEADMARPPKENSDQGKDIK